MNNKNINIQKPELLAPAGNFDALKAAVTNGADAVYLGLSDFSARALAENFTLENLKTAVDYAHLFGVRVYVAINTLIKSSEITHAVTSAIKAWEAGVSAIIIQDFGLAKCLKEIAPHIVLHASTQMGIHNLDGALAAQRLGIERIILSRETPLAEIVNISKNCDIEIEHFVHGALCCSFSGNCYLSSLVSNNSGNRGKCLQLCRKPYLLTSKQGNICETGKKARKNESFGYWLSTRDTMLIKDIDKLREAGVCSFKIEGRMRRKEYVAEAVRLYRKAIDDSFKSDKASISEKDIDSLKLMFNRGDFSKVHLDGRQPSGIIYSHLQSHMGIRIGSVSSVFSQKARLDCLVNKGDGLKFLSDNKEVGHALVLQDGFETGFVGDVRAGDCVHLTDSRINNEQINQRKRRLPLDIEASFKVRENTAVIKLKTDDRESEFSYSVVLEKPKNSPLSIEDIEECLTSLGATNFQAKSVSIDFDEPFFAPKSVLKQLKRDFIRDFEDYLISSFYRPQSSNHTSFSSNDNISKNIWQQLKPIDVSKCNTIIMCDSSDTEIYQDFADYLVLKPSNYARFLEDILAGKFSVDRQKFILDLPNIAFSDDIECLKKIIKLDVFDKFMANNIYALELAKDKKLMLGYKMNILGGQIDFPYIKTIEPSLFEPSFFDGFRYTYGRPEVMQFVHCYYNMQSGCQSCSEASEITLTDDHGESFRIKRQKVASCYNYMVSARLENQLNDTKLKKLIDATNITASEKAYLLEYLAKNNKCFVSF